jgi:hypothetical protein
MFDKQKTGFFLLALLLAGPGFHAAAQTLDEQYGPKSTKENSPYSRYGIGNLNNNSNSLIRGLGGTATAFNDVFSVNSFNPATYSFLKATTLDFALEASSNKVSMGDKSYSSGTAILSYLNLGIPLGKNLGMNLGFKPIAHTYYNANDTTNVAGIGSSIYNYNGDGNMQFAYIGFSGRYKGFSIGFNAGYVFGNYDYANSLTALDSGGISTSIRDVELSHNDQVGGLYWKGGLLYCNEVKKGYFLNIGAAFTLSQPLNIKRNSYAIAYETELAADGSQAVGNIDTISSTLGTKGTLDMPLEYSFGINYGKSFHWNVGADFQYTDWSSFQKMGEREGIADNSYRASVGAQFTPDPEATGKKYFSMVTYRLGAYYGKDYLNINNTEIDYMGGTIGASFPLKRNYDQFGRINTALDIGQRGTLTNGLAKEFFVKFTLGVSLNDIWFIRPKYH